MTSWNAHFTKFGTAHEGDVQQIDAARYGLRVRPDGVLSVSTLVEYLTSTLRKYKLYREATDVAGSQYPFRPLYQGIDHDSHRWEQQKLFTKREPSVLRS